jgi:hypothetical protein
MCRERCDIFPHLSSEPVRIDQYHPLPVPIGIWSGFFHPPGRPLGYGKHVLLPEWKFFVIKYVRRHDASGDRQEPAFLVPHNHRENSTQSNQKYLTKYLTMTAATAPRNSRKQHPFIQSPSDGGGHPAFPSYVRRPEEPSDPQPPKRHCIRTRKPLDPPQHGLPHDMFIG